VWLVLMATELSDKSWRKTFQFQLEELVSHLATV
jgi:hypothetical protein